MPSQKIVCDQYENIIHAVQNNVTELRVKSLFALSLRVDKEQKEQSDLDFEKSINIIINSKTIKKLDIVINGRSTHKIRCIANLIKRNNIIELNIRMFPFAYNNKINCIQQALEKNSTLIKLTITDMASIIRHKSISNYKMPDIINVLLERNKKLKPLMFQSADKMKNGKFEDIAKQQLSSVIFNECFGYGNSFNTEI